MECNLIIREAFVEEVIKALKEKISEKATVKELKTKIDYQLFQHPDYINVI